MGQAKIRYVDESGWIDDILRKISAYAGPSIHRQDSPHVEEEDEARLAAESALASRGGFQNDPAARGHIERYAIERAVEFYAKKGFLVEEVGRPYDLKCVRKSPFETIYVEVKGTQGTAEQVILTRGEVEHYSQHPSELFVVHGIEWNGKRASGGKLHHLPEWKPVTEHLTPISYFYRVPPLKP